MFVVTKTSSLNKVKGIKILNLEQREGEDKIKDMASQVG